MTSRAPRQSLDIRPSSTGRWTRWTSFLLMEAPDGEPPATAMEIEMSTSPWTDPPNGASMERLSPAEASGASLAFEVTFTPPERWESERFPIMAAAAAGADRQSRGPEARAAWASRRMFAPPAPMSEAAPSPRASAASEMEYRCCLSWEAAKTRTLEARRTEKTTAAAAVAPMATLTTKPPGPPRMGPA